MRRVIAHFPEKLLDEYDKFWEDEGYPSRAEALRASVRAQMERSRGRREE